MAVGDVDRKLMLASVKVVTAFAVLLADALATLGVVLSHLRDTEGRRTCTKARPSETKQAQIKIEGERDRACKIFCLPPLWWQRVQWDNPPLKEGERTCV